MRRMIQPFNIVERVLRGRISYLAEIARGEALLHKIGELLAITTFGLAVFGFVGTQMGWALRPFFGYPGAPFEIVRRMQGTFYTGVFNIIRRMLGF